MVIILSWIGVNETIGYSIAAGAIVLILVMFISDLQTKVILTDQKLEIKGIKKKISYKLDQSTFSYHMREGSHTARSYHLIIKTPNQEEQRINLAALGETQFYDLLENLKIIGDESNIESLKTKKL